MPPLSPLLNFLLITQDNLHQPPSCNLIFASFLLHRHQLEVIFLQISQHQNIDISPQNSIYMF